MVGRTTILAAVALLLSTVAVFAQVDVTPLVNDAIEWVNAAALILAAVVSKFIVSWLSAQTGLKNAETEAILAAQMDAILRKGIGLAYANAKAQAQKAGKIEIDFGNMFINMAANYAAKSGPEIIQKFGITRDRLEEMIIARLPDWMTENVNIDASQLDIVAAASKRALDNA